MEIRETVVLGQNVTLVYDQIDLKSVDTTRLKSLVEIDPGPSVWDTPELIIAAYPPSPAVLRMGEGRVSVTMNQQDGPIGQPPMWDLVEGSHKLVSELGSNLRAFGLNMDIGFVLTDGDPLSLTRRCFLRDAVAVQDTLGGELLSFAPKLIFARDGRIHVLTLEPVDSGRLKASLNVHTEEPDLVLPSKDELSALHQSEYERLTADVPALLALEP